MITRRSFLADTSLGLLAAGIALPKAIASAPIGPASPAQIDFTRFEQCLNTRFAVRQNGREARAVKLAEVTRHPVRVMPARMGGAKLEEFSLLFTGSRDAGLTQDTYTFEHAELGRFEMFIVPVERETSGPRQYQAVFNRITNA